MNLAGGLPRQSAVPDTDQSQHSFDHCACCCYKIHILTRAQSNINEKPPFLTENQKNSNSFNYSDFLSISRSWERFCEKVGRIEFYPIVQVFAQKDEFRSEGDIFTVWFVRRVRQS